MIQYPCLRTLCVKSRHKWLSEVKFQNSSLKKTYTAHTREGITKPIYSCPASSWLSPTLPMAQDPISSQLKAISPCYSDAIGVPDPIPVPKLLSAFPSWTSNLNSYLAFTWWSPDLAGAVCLLNSSVLSWFVVLLSSQ